MARKTVDPLADAKVATPTVEETEDFDAPATPAAAAAVLEDVKVVLPSASADMKKRPKRYRVLRKITTSWKGQMITLQADEEISEASYGPGCVARLSDAGVALEELPG